MNLKSKERAPTKDNALSEHTKQNTHNVCIFAELRETIKVKLLSGLPVRLIDYASYERGLAMAALASLRDELPVRCGWQTVRESHASETRTRARTYSIPGEFLREGSHV